MIEQMNGFFQELYRARPDDTEQMVMAGGWIVDRVEYVGMKLDHWRMWPLWKPALRWLCKIAGVAAVAYMVCVLIADWVTI